MTSNEIEDAMSEQFNPGLDPDDPALGTAQKGRLGGDRGRTG